MGSDLLSLKGRVALVTGAGQGVGRQVALDFAANGCDTVLVNDYFNDRACSVVDEIKACGGKAVAVVGDVTDYEDVSRWLPEAARTAGGLHIVVNNAGNAGATGDLSKLPCFWEAGPQDWSKWLGTNLYGVLNVCHVAIPEIIRCNKGGSIVNVISDAGRVGEPRLVVYSAAKGGASAFSRALAKEIAPHAIRVNAVALSGVNTPGIAPLLADPEVIKRIVKQYPLGRMGEPSDPSNLILFLASDASSWITAQTYPVNGGYAISQ